MEANKTTMQYLADAKRQGAVRTEALKQASKKALKKTGLFLIFFGLASGAGTYGLVKVNEWFEDNALVIKSPVEVAVKTNQVLAVVKREKTTIVKSEQAKIDAIVEKEDDKDLAKYICDKFGAVECKTALAVAKAESGMDCNAIHLNTNGSVDFSVYQINSVHLNKYTLADLADCRKNVDIAYEMWSAQGWNPWVAYTTEAYLSKL